MLIKLCEFSSRSKQLKTNCNSRF